MSSIGHRANAEDAVSALLSNYSVEPGAWDAMRDMEGNLRPDWQVVLADIARMSSGERQSFRDNAEKMLRDNGVTFVARDEAGGHERPWQLDMLPVLISPEDWTSLEQGLAQRARLLNCLLADLYGPRRAIGDGILPPSAVYGNSQFLRPCANISVRNDVWLHYLAFDVARAADGTWWVMNDRCEAPSGAGFTLENRVVASRCLPSLFSRLQVRRQANFFRAFNDQLLGCSGRDNPVAVYLSRGPTKSTYFEHAYLARYLGYSVVEGSDLTVRDDRVYVKTVEGLRPVDLILRALRSEMCDPLELRGDSLIGIPGLLQAARAGNVTIANAPGSGLVESDAFLAYLDALSEYYFKEDLQLPSIPTWWCGQEEEREHVIANLDSFTIRRISATRTLLGSDDGRIGTNGIAPNHDELAAMIRSSGHDFVGQQPFPATACPVLGKDENLESAPVVIRCYVAATENGYRVMPGGLARVGVAGSTAGAFVDSGISKDVWVLSDTPVDRFSLLEQHQNDGRLRRGGRDLPSRAADNMFWLGRYTERAEVAVRLLRCLVMRLHGEVGATRLPVSLDNIVTLLVASKRMSARRGKRVAQLGIEAVQSELWSILFDSDSRDGLATVLGNVQRNAEVVRERLSFDAFRVLMELTKVRGDWGLGARRDTQAALQFLNRLIQCLAAFSGMVMENMTRGYGWRFLDMGRRIERIGSMASLVQQLVVHGDPKEQGGLDLMLELADSTMTYRGRYHATPQITRVLDLLLADESNPRSLLFQAHSIGSHLESLPHTDPSGMVTPDRQLARQIASELELADMHTLAETVSKSGKRARLDRLIRRLDSNLLDLSDLISQHYFSHSTATRVSGSPGLPTES